jgi:hypothetical protein
MSEGTSLGVCVYSTEHHGYDVMVLEAIFDGKALFFGVADSESFDEERKEISTDQTRIGCPGMETMGEAIQAIHELIENVVEAG